MCLSLRSKGCLLLVVLFCYFFLTWKPGNSEEALCSICNDINEIPGVKNMQIIKKKEKKEFIITVISTKG